MKVLTVSWKWYPVGGDWTYVENMNRLYEANGYEVVPFSTQHPNNLPNGFEDYYVKAYDYKELNKNKNLKTSFQALKNSIVSFEALKKLDDLLEKVDISFAHLHMIHHWITPAIIWKLKKKNIPVIWTLHEYKILCPEGTFVSNGKVCEKCYGGRFYNCAINKCKKQSLMASSLAAMDAYFYHTSNIYDSIDAYLCPSQFLMSKFKQFGFTESKLRLTNLCYDIASIDSSARLIKERIKEISTDPFILYVGRIETFKGIKTLIKAVDGTDIQLKIAGTGAALEEMRGYVIQNQIEGISFLGFQTKESVYELTMKSICVVCPSEWYENYPFSVIESLLLSTPVIGAKIGGIPELVIDGETGLLHEPGDFLDLRQKMLMLWADRELSKKLGIQARQYAYSKVNFNTHWAIIEDIISRLPLKKSFEPHNYQL